MLEIYLALYLALVLPVTASGGYKSTHKGCGKYYSFGNVVLISIIRTKSVLRKSFWVLFGCLL